MPLLCLLLCGCQAVKLTSTQSESARAPQIVAPSKYSLRVSQFLFLSDRELKPSTPLFEELAALRDAVFKELQLPPSNTIIQVYLFEDRARYERFMRSRYPELPKRRAFFVAQPRSIGGVEDLLVYTFWGDRVRLDLRHELTHALLHSVLKEVPLWLDEGLAEFYEVPPEWHGVHYPHLEHVRVVAQEPLKPDLARLEQLTQVQQMTPAEYREAWAWVHLLLRGKPEGKTLLLDYLKQLRSNPSPGPLAPHLAAAYPALNESLEQHLAELQNQVRPASALDRR
jgi:hypothetical protein